LACRNSSGLHHQSFRQWTSLNSIHTCMLTEGLPIR
jgi:hypothetical protein